MGYTIRAIDELYPWADADIDGSSPKKVWWEAVYYPPSLLDSGGWRIEKWTRPALSHNAVADVWDFSFSDATEWKCFQSGDTTCHECN